MRMVTWVSATLASMMPASVSKRMRAAARPFM